MKLLRFYALLGIVLVLVSLPVFLIDFGADRRFPLLLSRHLAADATFRILSPSGEALPGDPRLVAVSIAEGPFQSATSAEAIRRMPNLPVGTSISYRISDEKNATSVISGVVEGIAVDRSTAISRAVEVLLCFGFVFAGASLALGGLDARSMLAAAGLTGLAINFGSHVAASSFALTASPRIGEILAWAWSCFPADLAPAFLFGFLATFPANLSRRRVVVVLQRSLAAVAGALAILLAVIVTPGILDGRAVGVQTAVLVWSLRLQLTLYALVAGAVSIVLYLQVVAARREFAPQRDKDRARFVGRVLVASSLPTLMLVVAQAVSLILRDEFLVPPLVMELSFLPFLLVPAALVYASLAPEVQPLGLLVRRAILFPFSSVSLAVLSFLPLAGLLIYFWSNRDATLATLVARNPVPLTLATGVALAGVLTRDRLQRSLEKLFFREREDARKTLRALAERTRAAGGPSELANLLAREIEAALHVDSVALFVRRREGDFFQSPGRPFPTLGTESSIASEVRARQTLDLDPDAKDSVLHALPELERHWVAETHARFVLALLGGDGSVLGLLVVGEKLSELPYDRDDLLLLGAVASSGALALENSVLRSSAGVGLAASALPAPERDAERALGCLLCGRLFSPALLRLCPEHQRALEPVDVPHLLAGKFRLERRIGAGGMGVVYLARDLSLSRPVAIKTLPRMSAESAIRLRREARAMARLLHPNLAVIFATETWHQTPFLIVEYLDGGTLATRITLGSIATDDVMMWGVRLASALETAHARGVLHRDIKPSNVGFTGAGTPKLLDFGLASILEESDVVVRGPAPVSGDETADVGVEDPGTSRGHVVGTAPYLAPEAILGKLPQAGFDLWSLAVTLWEATAGVNPFFAGSTQKTVERILGETAPDVRQRRPDCPGPFAEFLGMALARDAGDRPRTAREFRRALERATAVSGVATA